MLDLTAATLSACNRRCTRHGQPQAHGVVLEVAVIDEHERWLQQDHEESPDPGRLPTMPGDYRVPPPANHPGYIHPAHEKCIREG